MDSLWTMTEHLKQRAGLTHDAEVDVAVLGGGMAGVLTAFFLKKHGRSPVIFDAGSMGGGQTRNTTAKITAQHGLCYSGLIKKHGKEKAGLYAAANRQAIEDYHALAGELGAACQLERCPAYLYSRTQTLPLERECDAARSLGFDARLVTDTELPFPVSLALRFDRQARMHPLKLLQAAARDLSVCEHTRALRVGENEIETDHGIIRANAIVFTTHYPFLNAPGYYFMRLHQERSYVLALEHAQSLDGMYYGIDEDCSWSMRSAGKYLLFGGGGHRTGENSGGGRYEALKKAAAGFWPESRVAAQWSAQDCMPPDGVPFIGRFSSATPNWFVATGFQKWGMTSAMVAARLLSDLICGAENPYEALFSPQRFTPAASATQMLEDGLQAVRGLSREFLSFPQAQLEALAPGYGGILAWEDKKVGAYRDEHGSVHLVIPKCPHLGCQLSWNPDEKSWDCPCHGSRFDYKGHLLDNPAQDNLLRP